MNKNKLYIAVLDEVPDHMVPVLVAHAVLGAHIEFSTQAEGSAAMLTPHMYPDYMGWLKDSFRKVVLKVNRKEFTKILALEDVFLAHENTTLGGEKSCAVVCPREVYPNVIKFAKMWTPMYTPSVVDLTVFSDTCKKMLTGFDDL